ncbi:hypothetical protein BV25DRAFT_1921740 [Artomyces pyxidatus]|uniref:Uncharacterized protein n=1 Tax=Artomyces pyxidatus TaxID=48021 RepID=A0ACB8SH40_9AGAM|nr:hypothetical protein BV25DRAFT_1921740 [Artomyces pyxidatus]
MVAASKKKQSAAGGAAGSTLTPAQKAAATRKANREKREAAAAAADSPRPADLQDINPDNDADDPGSGRAARPRRAAASTAAQAGQGDESGTRKRAASSAEPRGTEGSAKRAPKQRKSDIAAASNNAFTAVDEDGEEQASSHDDTPMPDAEQLQFIRPRPPNAQRKSPAQTTAIARAPAGPAAGGGTGAEAEEQEEDAEDKGEDEGATVDDAHASDEAEGDEAWAGTEELQDDEGPAKKTSKALARQFEQATPVWVRKSDGKTPARRRRSSPSPQGRHASMQSKTSSAGFERDTRGPGVESPNLHPDGDHDDALTRVQDHIEAMNIDRHNVGASQRAHRHPTTSRSLRIASPDEDGPATIHDAEDNDVELLDDREPVRQLSRRPTDRGPHQNHARDVVKSSHSHVHAEHEAFSHSQDNRPYDDHSAHKQTKRQSNGLDFGEARAMRTPGRAHRGHGPYDHYRHDGDRNMRVREGDKNGYGEQGGNRGRDHDNGRHDRWGYDRRESNTRERSRDGNGHMQSSSKQRGATRSQHGRQRSWSGNDDVVEIDASSDEPLRHKHIGGPRPRHSNSDSEEERPHRRPHDHVRVKQERGAPGRVRRRTRATFVIHSDDEVEEEEEEGAASEGSQVDDGLPRDGQWLGSTKFNMGKGRPTLADQFERVANVISYTCATEVPKFVCFEDAFPLADDRVPLYRKALIKGAKATKSRTILARLESELSYVEKMAIIPEGRVSIFRGKVRDRAAAGVKMHYKFSSFPPNDFTNIIGKLLEDRRHIFPGDAVKKTIEDERPYCHSSLIYIIHESFFGGNPIKKFPVEYYPLSAKTKKRQLPKSMVALAATANEAALMAYRMGPTAVKIVFYGDTFDNVYGVHIATLDSIYDNDPETYDGLMTYLYEQVSGEASAVGPSSSSRRGDQVRPISIVTANMAKRFK